MNLICTYLRFTMELCSDFRNNRLEEDGIKHNYFEKSMENHISLVERSFMGRHSLLEIMSNEIIRRLEVLHDDVS